MRELALKALAVLAIFSVGGVFGSMLDDRAVENVTLTEPMFTAFKVDVNDALAEPFTDAQVECVVIHAQTERTEVLMAGPCVTTYP